MPRKTLETLVKETKWVYKNRDALLIQWLDPSISTKSLQSKIVKRPIMSDGKEATDKQWIEHAKDLQAQYRRESEQRTPLTGNPFITMSELAVHWSENSVDSTANGLRPKTIRGYKGIARKIAKEKAFQILPARDLQTSDVANFYQRLGKRDGNSSTTIANTHTGLKMVLNYGVEQNLIDKNIMGVGKYSSIKKPKTKGRKRKIPIEPDALQELRRLSNNKFSGRDKWFEAYVWTLTYTGMYPSEALGLTWNHIHLDEAEPYIAVRRSQAYIPKQGGVIDEDEVKRASREREIPMAEDYVEIMKEYREYQKVNAKYSWSDKHLNATKVFCGPSMQPIKNDRAGRYLRNIADKMNRHDINALNLRHAFACCLVRQGLLAPDTKQIMGHKNITTTLEIYADVLPDVSSQARILINDYMKGKTNDISTKVMQKVMHNIDETLYETANS